MRDSRAPCSATVPAMGRCDLIPRSQLPSSRHPRADRGQQACRALANARPFPDVRSMRRVAGLWLALVLSMGSASAQEESASNPVPPFAELEAAGAVIGEIRIDNQNIFDLDDPKENNALFRLANKLHIRTRPDTIRRALLFNSGELLSVRLIEETERLLRSNHYIYDVRIRPAAYHDGIVDIEVTTRDTWTINLGLKFSRGGGSNTTGLGISDQNFLGTGIAIGVDKTSDVDRTGREFFISRNNALDGWTTVEYRHANFDDGTANTFKLDRPFYALDTRWAAGLSAKSNSRIDSIYDSSNIIGQYRHNFDSAEVYGGWSRGLVD